MKNLLLTAFLILVLFDSVYAVPRIVIFQNPSQTNALHDKGELVVTKLTQVYNRTFPRLTLSYKRYTSWIDLKQGVTGKENAVYGLYKIEDLDTESISYNKIDSSLVNAFKNYLDNYQKTKLQIDKIYDYYDQKDYQDDQFALGKKLHPQIITSFQEAISSGDALYKVLKDSINSINSKRLKTLDRNKSEYLFMNLFLTAEQIAYQITQANNKNFIPQTKELLDQFNETINQLDFLYSQSDTKYLTSLKSLYNECFFFKSDNCLANYKPEIINDLYLIIYNKSLSEIKSFQKAAKQYLRDRKEGSTDNSQSQLDMLMITQLDMVMIKYDSLLRSKGLVY